MPKLFLFRTWIPAMGETEGLAAERSEVSAGRAAEHHAEEWFARTMSARQSVIVNLTSPESDHRRVMCYEVSWRTARTYHAEFAADLNRPAPPPPAAQLPSDLTENQAKAVVAATREHLSAKEFPPAPSGTIDSFAAMVVAPGTKLYLLWCEDGGGERHLVGIFTTRDRAEHEKAMKHRMEDYEITEWFDPPAATPVPAPQGADTKAKLRLQEVPDIVFPARKWPFILALFWNGPGQYLTTRSLASDEFEVRLTYLGGKHPFTVDLWRTGEAVPPRSAIADNMVEAIDKLHEIFGDQLKRGMKGGG